MPPPDYIYKYQALSAHSLASLLNGTIWMAKPCTFNDPFDCALMLDKGKMKESIAFAVSQAIERFNPMGPMPNSVFDAPPGDAETFNDYREKTYKMVQKRGFCSFSAVPDHLLMWSHYADQHRGVCVEYDCREGTAMRTHLSPVKYEDEMPSLSMSDLHHSNTFEPLWLTKAKPWAYEQEWRLQWSEGNCSIPAPSDVTAVIFGARMPEAERTMVATALRHQKDIQFKEARLRDGHFLIDIVDL